MKELIISSKETILAFLLLSTLNPSLCTDSFIDKLRKSASMENGLFISYDAKATNVYNHLHEFFTLYMENKKKYYEHRMR